MAPRGMPNSPCRSDESDMATPRTTLAMRLPMSPCWIRPCFEPPLWHPSNHARFPPAHRAAVRTLLALHGRDGTPLALLPKDVLLLEILPRVPYGAFAPSCLPDDLVLNVSDEDGAVDAMSDGVSDGGDARSGDEPSDDEGSLRSDANESDDDEAQPSEEVEMEEAPAPTLTAPPPIVPGASCSRLLRCL